MQLTNQESQSAGLGKLKATVTANKKKHDKPILKLKTNSTRTVRCALHEENVRFCILLKKPLILEKNREIRLEWTMGRRNWTVADWKKVI